MIRRGHIDRRTFIMSTGAAGLAVAVAPRLVRAKPAYDKVRVAFVGVGGIAGMHTGNVARMGDVCPCYAEVDTQRMGNAAEPWPDAKAYQDYRKMFDREANNIDAVMVGTPDHHHYPASIIAMTLGKHCYTQKPLTHTIWEARQMSLAAQKYKVATQMGNQGHANEGNRLIYEWIKSGSIGDLVGAHCWTNRPVWPQGLARPEGADPVPDNLDWDVWLGPAPERPYKEGVYHPFSWRGWWDFGCGALGDMACHTMDGLYWALHPLQPKSVECLKRTEFTGDCFPSQSIVKWSFPAHGDRPAFPVYWYSGGLKPERPEGLEEGQELPNTGNLYIGTKATILVEGDYGDRPRIIPREKAAEIGKPPKMLERSIGHHEEWAKACRGEEAYDYPKSNFMYAGPFSEVVLLGVLSLQAGPGKVVEWDSANMRVTNMPELNRYVHKRYRSGWEFSM